MTNAQIHRTILGLSFRSLARPHDAPTLAEASLYSIIYKHVGWRWAPPYAPTAPKKVPKR